MTSYIPKILEIFGKRHIYPFRFSRVSLINRFKISKIFQKRHIYPSSYILIDPCTLAVEVSEAEGGVGGECPPRLPVERGAA